MCAGRLQRRLWGISPSFNSAQRREAEPSMFGGSMTMEGSPSLFPTFSQLGAKLKQAIELNFDSTFRKQFSDCKLRVFSLANRKDELDRETRNMAALLAKFRIDFSSVLVIPGRLSTPYNGKQHRHRRNVTSYHFFRLFSLPLTIFTSFNNFHFS